MTDLAIILGLVFSVICLAFVLLHSVHVGRLTLLDWAVLGMGGVYGLGWSLVAGVTRAGGNPVWEKWLSPNAHYYPLHTLCALVLLGSMSLGWLVFGALWPRRHRMRSSFSIRSNPSQLITVMWILLVIAIAMQWLYTSAYGGFLALLEYSAAIRSATNTVENRLSFLQPFGGLALFASYGFFGLWLSRCKRLAVRLGLCFSVPFSLYILYSWRGRIALLVYLVTFVLGLLLSRRPRPLALLFGASIALIAIVIGAYYLSIWLNLKPADDLVVYLTRELSFPFVSFFAQLDSGKNLPRLFSDFLMAPVYLLPSSLWSRWVEDVSQVNTALIMGAPKGQQGVTGEIPVDLLTLGLMQVSVLGILVVGGLFGALLRMIQSLLDRISCLGVRAVFEAHVALNVAVLGLFYAQPALVVERNFTLLVTALAITLYLKTPRLRWQGSERLMVSPRQ
jgi:hypothetical protein